MKTLTIIPTLAILTCLSATATARPHAPADVVSHLDHDGDGLISLNEFHMPRPIPISRFDEDGDGGLSLDELSHVREHRGGKHGGKRGDKRAQRPMEADDESDNSRPSPAERFAEIDTNGDGSVTAEELRLKAFQRRDENGDGFISVDEIKQRSHHGPRGQFRHHNRRFSERDS